MKCPFDKKYDVVIIENLELDKPVWKGTLVAASPYRTKTNNWLLGLSVITTLEEVLLWKRPVAAKSKDIERFLKKGK